MGWEHWTLTTWCRSPELVPLEKEFSKEIEGSEANKCLLKDKSEKIGAEKHRHLVGVRRRQSQRRREGKRESNTCFGGHLKHLDGLPLANRLGFAPTGCPALRVGFSIRVSGTLTGCTVVCALLSLTLRKLSVNVSLQRSPWPAEWELDGLYLIQAGCSFYPEVICPQGTYYSCSA